MILAAFIFHLKQHHCYRKEASAGHSYVGYIEYGKTAAGYHVCDIAEGQAVNEIGQTARDDECHQAGYSLRPSARLMYHEDQAGCNEDRSEYNCHHFVPCKHAEY